MIMMAYPSGYATANASLLYDLINTLHKQQSDIV